MTPIISIDQIKPGTLFVLNNNLYLVTKLEVNNYAYDYDQINVNYVCITAPQWGSGYATLDYLRSLPAFKVLC